MRRGLLILLLATGCGDSTRTVANVTRDYLALVFAGDDRLYVPHDHLDKVSRYVGADGGDPALSKLGGKSWATMKARARESVRELATAWNVDLGPRPDGCIRCRLCIRVCKEIVGPGALVMHKRDGISLVEPIEGRCIGCGTCFSISWSFISMDIGFFSSRPFIR